MTTRRPARTGLRFRLAVTVVALVALTAAVLGIGASVAVEAALRARLQDDAVRAARFDLAVLVPSALDAGSSRRDYEASNLPATFRQRGDVETVVDWGDGNPDGSRLGLGAATLAALPQQTRDAAASGDLAYAWVTVAGQPWLIVGGPSTIVPATFWFLRDATPVENAITTLRVALAAGALVLVLVAVVAARRVARGILSPIQGAALAAGRLGAGDLSARVPEGGSDELGALARAFNDMAETLERTVSRLRDAESQNRRFVADVAHELRTPTAALVAAASVVRDGLLRGELSGGELRAVELLVDDVARLRILVEDLMEISRFDAAAEHVVAEPVDIRDVVRSIAAARAPRAHLRLADEPLVVSAEGRRLDRILGNLLDNARNHAPGAAVEIDVEHEADEAVVVVRDHGPGVAPAALPHLFERFWKGDASRSRGTSGLGLAIAAEHAAVLGGSLRASLPNGGGLRVELRLPLAGPVAEPLPGGDPGVITGADAPAQSEPA